jgi:outer membrane protein assembly factor BamB
MTPPVVDAGMLYVAGGYFWNDDARVYALDAATGRERWRSSGGGPHDGDLTVAAGLVLAADDGVLTAYDRDSGAVRWRQHGSGGVYGRRTVSGALVHVRDGDAVAAYDLGTGTERWRYRTESPAITPPAIAGDALYFGTRAQPGVLTVLDRQNGQMRGAPRTVPGFNGTITAAGRHLLLAAGHEGRRVTYVLDPSSDQLQLVPHGLVAVRGDVAFFEAAPRRLQAWHVPEGRALWTREVQWDLDANRSVIDHEEAVVAGYEQPPGLRTLRVFDLQTGRLRWSFQADDWLEDILLTPSVVFVASEDCRVYAVGRRL